jgi:uncharacterized protein YndB with AHSA1/START domain
MTTEITVPPVRKTVTVPLPVEKAFALFTDKITTWWPLGGSAATASGQARAESVVLEPRPGGRIYQRLNDGSIAFLGEVLAFEPPHRLVLAWQPTEDTTAPTEVEVQFTAEDAQTRVDLEHRGWERLGEGATTTRADYDSGWENALRVYAAAGPDNGHAIAALVLGITSVFLPVLGLLAAPFGIVFGVLGRRRARAGARQGGLATAGLTLATIGLVLWTTVVILGAAVIVKGVSSGMDEAVPVERIDEQFAPAEP